MFKNKNIYSQAERVTASPLEGETGEGKIVNQKVQKNIFYLFRASTSYPIFSISRDAQMNGPTPLPSLSRIGSLM